ncbi:hypothetical protein [Halopseudomonas litoralis]|uniref:hypothetical protein n=1 Tax=Halopseudomonas litoralis TaxID=797277 RepID=UPI0012FE6505|nr:hypothetical protein [Halopseudomonas litoralis]
MAPTRVSHCTLIMSMVVALLTLYFHTDSGQLAQISNDYLLAETDANQTRNNYSTRAHTCGREAASCC